MNKFLGLFQTYSYSNLYHLPGVKKDFDNLLSLAEKLTATNEWQSKLLFDADYETIVDTLTNDRMALVWCCGHGILSIDGRNIFLIDDLQANLDDRTFFKLLAADTLTKLTLFVFDFCHSCTMINLKYYYKNGTFMSKVADTEPSLFDDNPLLTRVCIAGASDFDTTNEDTHGGYLTQYLINLLYKFGYVSLSLFEQHQPVVVKRSVISVNRIIDEHMPLLILNKENKKLQ